MNEVIEPVYHRVGEALKFLRLKAGMSQMRMADTFGIPTNTYRGYENAERRMPLNTLVDIAQYYNLSVNYFMDYGLEREKPEDTSNKIVVELKDADVINALSSLQEMDKDNREHAYEYLNYLSAKQKKESAKITE